MTECGGFAEPGHNQDQRLGYTVSGARESPALPFHDEKHLLLKDVTRWKEVLKRRTRPPIPTNVGADRRAGSRRGPERKIRVSLVQNRLFEKLHMRWAWKTLSSAFTPEPEAMA